MKRSRRQSVRSSPPQPRPHATGRSEPVPRVRVLVVDDHADTRDLLLTILKTEGYDVTLAEDVQLPSVRAYMVLAALAETGETLACKPTPDEVETFAGTEVDVWMVSERADAELAGAVAAVTDVAHVEVVEAIGDAAVDEAPKEAPKKAAKGSSTVRVDAERLETRRALPLLEAAREVEADAVVRLQIGERPRRPVALEICGRPNHGHAAFAELAGDELRRAQRPGADRDVRPLLQQVDHPVGEHDVERHLGVARQEVRHERQQVPLAEGNIGVDPDAPARRRAGSRVPLRLVDVRDDPRSTLIEGLTLGREFPEDPQDRLGGRIRADGHDGDSASFARVRCTCHLTVAAYVGKPGQPLEDPPARTPASARPGLVGVGAPPAAAAAAKACG